MSVKTLLAAGLVLTFAAGATEAQLPFNFGGESRPTLAPLLKEVTPAVVNISVVSQVQIARNPMAEDPLFRFFGLPSQPEIQPRQGAGSGVIVDAEHGYILTNHHVVEGANEIAVTLADRRQFEAELIGSDEGTDIALLKIDADNLKDLRLGDSDELEVGDFVLAIGNPFGLGQTVTSGIVSALGRSVGLEGYEDFIQTDASINPGNSGGALVNLDGELVGINTAIIAPGGGNVGIGFAVPMSMAEGIMKQLLEYGEVRRGRLGITIQDVTPGLAEALDLSVTRGAVVTQVDPDSPAERAGIEAGDIIVELNSDEVDGSSDLRNKVAIIPLGETADIRFVRDGDVRTTEVTIGSSAAVLAEGSRTFDRLRGAEFRTLDSSDPLYGSVVGVVVARLDQGSPAARSGLRAGDVITRINRITVRNVEELSSVLGRVQGAIALDIVRDNARLFVVIP